MEGGCPRNPPTLVVYPFRTNSGVYGPVVVAMGPYTPEFVRNGKHNVGGFLGQPLGPADLHKTNVIETETWRFEDREGRDGVKAGFPPVFVEHALGGDPEKSV